MIPFLDRLKQAFAPVDDDDVTNKKYVDDVAAGGILPWKETTPYNMLSDGRLRHIVWGGDNIIYVAKQPSGPGTAAGPQDPTTTTGYWLTLEQYISGGSGGGNGANGNDGLSFAYPSAFHGFMEQTPPVGWMVRNGGLIAGASVVVPALWEALQKPENAWKLMSEADWQAQSAAEPWNGIGGVPKFVLDVNANTIRLPDTRGMLMSDSGFSIVPNAGDVHGDAIRNIKGSLYITATMHNAENGKPPGAFGWKRAAYGPNGSGWDSNDLNFDASTVVPTAEANTPRVFGVLGCVYVGMPKGK